MEAVAWGRELAEVCSDGFILGEDLAQALEAGEGEAVHATFVFPKEGEKSIVVVSGVQARGDLVYFFEVFLSHDLGAVLDGALNVNVHDKWESKQILESHPLILVLD